MSLPQVAVGDALPELVILLDRTAIMACAVASQDFEDVHHDPGKAQERGMRDIFLSINTTNGLIDRYVTDWTGPAGRIAKTSLRLGVPQYPGDPMTFTGEVTSVDGGITVKVKGSNSMGVHVTADVTVVPAGGAA